MMNEVLVKNREMGVDVMKVQRGRRLYLGNLGEVISDEDYMLHLEKKRKCRTLLISMARVNRGWRYDQF